MWRKKFPIKGWTPLEKLLVRLGSKLKPLKMNLKWMKCILSSSFLKLIKLAELNPIGPISELTKAVVRHIFLYNIPRFRPYQ